MSRERQTPHAPGRWRFLSEFHGMRRYWVRNIGSVSVAYIEPRTPNNPSDRPWHLVNWGRTFATPEDALAHAIATWELEMMRKPELTDAVIRGIIGATSRLLADDLSNMSDEQEDELNAADTWAREMRAYYAARRKTRPRLRRYREG